MIRFKQLLTLNWVEVFKSGKYTETTVQGKFSIGKDRFFPGVYLAEDSHKDGLWSSMHVLLCWPTHASLFASFAGCMGLRDSQGFSFRDLPLSIIVQWDIGCVPRAKEQS